jgi:hypothetical protein
MYTSWELEQELFLFFVSICDHLAAATPSLLMSWQLAFHQLLYA